MSCIEELVLGHARSEIDGIAALFQGVATPAGYEIHGAIANKTAVSN